MKEKIFYLGYLSAIEVPIRWKLPDWFRWNLEGHWVVHYADGDILSHFLGGQEKGFIKVFANPKDALLYIEETRDYWGWNDWDVSIELCTWEEVMRLAKKHNAQRILIGREIIHLLRRKEK